MNKIILEYPECIMKTLLLLPHVLLIDKISRSPQRNSSDLTGQNWVVGFERRVTSLQRPNNT